MASPLSVPDQSLVAIADGIDSFCAGHGSGVLVPDPEEVQGQSRRLQRAANLTCTQNRLKDYNVGLSLPSQRVDRFDENISNILTSGTSKRSGLTFAPEAGTQRLRDIINKGLTNEELLR